MKALRKLNSKGWMPAILFVLFSAHAFEANAQKGEPVGKNVAAASYTCPMHPEIHASKPGKCPKCGMDLIKEKAKTTKPAKQKARTEAKPKTPAATDSYTCPMHPEIHAPKPGKCPKCGMDLVKDQSSVKQSGNTSSKSHEHTDGEYSCPMHPEVKSDKPGKCPKCGMDLVKNKAGEKDDDHAAMDHDMGNMPAGDDGSLQENISSAKAKLGSIKTVKAKQPPSTVRYDLHIRDTVVTFGKKKRHAIAVNGQIPMPTLTFTEGDVAEIHVFNEMDEETSLHWHGLFLPNKEDGVPYLTQMPIKPHSEYVYNFPIVQHGTHWYHSHSELQEQIGMYGAFIMNKREEWDIPTIPVVISEWTDMKPEEVHRRLKNANDYFAIQKGATQSYSEAIASGNFGTKITNEWKRMTAMDVSDVYYDTFLVNGKNREVHPQFKAGDKVRLRIANGGASDYFWLTWSGGKITVVASDGNEVEPVEVDRLIIAVSETYDVVVTIPENKAYEFLVTPEDRTKSASLWLGSGEKVSAEPLPRLKYFEGMKMMNGMMDMRGNMVEMEGMRMQNQIMDMNTVMYQEITGPADHETRKADADGHDHSNKGGGQKPIVTLNYEMLRAPKKTTLPEGPWRELKFELTGNMNRYVWSLDNKVVSETDKILIKKGENLRIVLYNNSMMRHPMHLHGHDFRVINGQGDYAPMKNIIDIMPMERDTIEFAATEPGGDWFFHCHILYHMMSGMGRVFSYENSPPNPEIPDPKRAMRMLNSDDREFHFMFENDFATNGNDGMAMLSNTRWQIGTEWRLGYEDMHGYESETHIGRYIGRMQWLMPFIGFDWRYRDGQDERNLFGQRNTKDKRAAVTAGIEYTLPLLFRISAEVYSNGNFRMQLRREDIPLTPRLRMNMMVNTDREYMAGFRYIITKNFAPSIHYDSDMGLGGGVTFTY